MHALRIALLSLALLFYASASAAALQAKKFIEETSSYMVIMGSNAGNSDWDGDAVISAINPLTKTLSVTNHGWMMPYTMFGITKVPEEHGEWAGKIAIEILNSTRPSNIPIIPNRRFEITINNALLAIADIELPEFMRLKSRPFH